MRIRANAGWTENQKLYSTMKTKLHLQSLTAIFFLIVSLGTAPAQKGPGAPPAVDPNTGLPITMPQPGSAGGLAAPQPAPQWKDPNWKDPDIVLTNVDYEIPLSRVVPDLRERFKDSFDVLANGNGDFDTSAVMIRLQLKNVTASEVFNAMNLVFENDRTTPLRWELKMNGKRPTALLRVLAQPDPKNPPLVIDPTTGLPMPPPETKRGVYFVGNLLGDEKNGDMTMEQLVQTLSEVHQMSFGSESGLQFHKQAQLVIVTGTDAEIEFIGNTLTALRQKEELDAARKAQSKSAESKPKSEATKTP